MGRFWLYHCRFSSVVKPFGSDLEHSFEEQSHKGVEEQTEKLVEVCRMRSIPMIVFINKLDREGKDAFDLMDEVDQKLGLRVTPLTFPIGMGYDFQGIYNIFTF